MPAWQRFPVELYLAHRRPEWQLDEMTDSVSLMSDERSNVEVWIEISGARHIIDVLRPIREARKTTAQTGVQSNDPESAPAASSAPRALSRRSIFSRLFVGASVIALLAALWKLDDAALVSAWMLLLRGLVSLATET